MLRYLERGSEKGFCNFCEALCSTGQAHLVNRMNESVAVQEQSGSCIASQPVPSSTCAQSAAVQCMEPIADETRKSSTELATECFQGYPLLLCYYLHLVITDR